MMQLLWEINKGFITANPGYEDLIYSIIDKDLKTRTGAKVINKAFPNLIPEFNVALAQTYEPKLASFGEGRMKHGMLVEN